MADESRSADALTDSALWDGVWSKTVLPAEMKRARTSVMLNAMLDVFDRFLPADRPQRVLEVGGAPGQYLVYQYRRGGHEIHCMDYAEVGCAKARENFALLGIPGQVHLQDLFADGPALPAFDFVYSLGLIEHFEDLCGVVERHVRLVRPGGTLLLGCPNYRGINRWILSRLAPKLLAVHNLDTMDLQRWDEFERRLGLRRLYRGYIGGFDPMPLLRLENPTAGNRLLRQAVRATVLLRRWQARLRIPRLLNGMAISAYCMGVYQTPEA